MSATQRIGVLVSVLLLAGIGFGGYWVLQRTGRQQCAICNREINQRARAFREVNGERQALCCVRCALTDVRQEGKPVDLVEVTDFVTMRKLRPADAFYVEGSRVVLCTLHEHRVDETKRAEMPVFDRCEPSIFAFAKREDADDFIAANGGALRRLPELLQEVQKEVPKQP